MQSSSANYDAFMRKGGDAAVREACQFFMKADLVHETLRHFVREVDELGVPYAVAGGMSLVAHGYVRTTEDIDVVVTAEGLEAIRAALEGRGYLPPYAGSKNLRNTRTGVRVEFLISGQFPGDGMPKPIAFPDPAKVSERIDGVAYVPLPALIELKLASGMTNAGRLRDLADVQELIRALNLTTEYSQRLNPYVREKFDELWRSVRESPDLT
jgi:hypothetical protein